MLYFLSKEAFALNDRKEKEWYDDANVVTSLLIGILILILIISQAFAIRHQMGIDYMLRSLFNYNTIYVFFLSYFVLLKTKVGKRYFQLMNVILTVLEVLVLFGSILNVIQFFGLGTLFNLIMNIVLLTYMGYVLLRETKIWDLFHFEGLQLHLIKNSQFFTALSFINIIILVIELINSIEFDHVVLKLMECIYMIGFARYLYLYQDYQEKKEREPLEEKEEEWEATREIPGLSIEEVAKEDKKSLSKKKKGEGK